MSKKCFFVWFTILFIILGCFITIYILNDRKVAVLGYHGILPRELNTSGDNLIVDQENFEEQLKTLKKMGYKSLTLDEFYCWKNGSCKKPHKSILITFDDGYINNYNYAFDLLKKYDMNAVVFIIGSTIDDDNGIQLNQSMIDDIKNNYSNIELASHSYDLHYHGDKSYDMVNDDISMMSIDSLYYAYPYGEYNDDYIRALQDNGYKLAFGFGPGKKHKKADISDNNYDISRLNISKDMPLWKFILRVKLPL